MVLYIHILFNVFGMLKQMCLENTIILLNFIKVFIDYELTFVFADSQ